MIKSYNLANKNIKFLDEMCKLHLEDNSSAILRRILNMVEYLHSNGIDITDRSVVLQVINKMNEV